MTAKGSLTVDLQGACCNGSCSIGVERWEELTSGWLDEFATTTDRVVDEP